METSVFEAPYLAIAHLRRAETRDARGELDLAVEHCARFIELWGDADPEFQPRGAAARERLADISGWLPLTFPPGQLIPPVDHDHRAEPWASPKNAEWRQGCRHPHGELVSATTIGGEIHRVPGLEPSRNTSRCGIDFEQAAQFQVYPLRQR